MRLAWLAPLSSPRQNGWEDCNHNLISGPIPRKAPPLKRRATTILRGSRECCSPGLQTRGFTPVLEGTFPQNPTLKPRCERVHTWPITREQPQLLPQARAKDEDSQTRLRFLQ